MAQRITSRENDKIKYACKLARSAAFRGGEHAFFAEGLKLCTDLAAACPLKVIFYTAAALEKTPALAQMGQERCLVEEHVAEKLAEGASHQGVFGVFERPAARFEDLPVPGRLLALERVQDPGNVGTLIRSAAAFGFDGVILSEGCASPYAPKTLRASMGAAVRVPVIETGPLPPALARLRQLGIRCLAAALEHSEPLGPVPAAHPGGVCVVVGSEGQGLEGDTIAACDAAVRIPMTDRVESLNAGIAGSILLWHFREVEV